MRAALRSVATSSSSLIARTESTIPRVGTSLALPAVSRSHSRYGSTSASNCTVPFSFSPRSIVSARFVISTATPATDCAASA